MSKTANFRSNGKKNGTGKRSRSNRSQAQGTGPYAHRLSATEKKNRELKQKLGTDAYNELMSETE